ncbi:MAG: ABC transporter permease [Clostridiales Family XIII bacterium]|nr:ABC transporter permease [Clostridiales Family XIII bacterium]
MLFLENVKLALLAIKSNKMRSFLTMLGIIIGTSSVIAITTIGDGASSAVSAEFDSFGKNNANIYPNTYGMDYSDSSDRFTSSDIAALNERFGSEIEYVSPYYSAATDVKIGRMSGQFNLSSVSGNYIHVSGGSLAYGRDFSQSDIDNRREFVIIPEEAAKKFFGRGDVAGESISMSFAGQIREMTIIGVYRQKDSIFSRLMSGTSYAAYVPYTLWNDAPSEILDLYVGSSQSISASLDKITSYLALIHKRPADHYIGSSVEAQQTRMTQIMGVLSVAIGAIAAISLLVGGIGIMNIMLVSVTERTREIGIRKSLGAKTGDILVQFLIEAMLVSALGGLIGATLGIGVATVGMGLANVSVNVDPFVVLLSVGFSAMVGMFFGLYPARKAAKLDPIEALRYE